MVNIGEFARLGGVSTRMLRHYDAIGILKPADVDPASGRRSYDVAQLAVLNRLVALKGLGFSLEEVGVLLREGVDPAQLHGMLRLRQAEFERRVRHDRHALDRVTARLRLIEQETQVTTQIETKQVDALILAARSATADDASRQSAGSVVQSLFGQVIDRMEAATADRTTPVAHYVSSGGDAEVQVMAGYAVPADSVPGLTTYKLPAAEVASTIHQGPMSGIAAAYQTLAQWAEANGHHAVLAAPRWREHYLEADGEDETHWIVEVQLEVG
jgi:DNA-binding transcriptional MerR regulator/effector-binding domain-containing protein